MSQEEFARKLGVSYTTVNRWENGKNKPTPQAITSMETLAEEHNIRIRPALMRRGQDVKFKAKKK